MLRTIREVISVSKKKKKFNQIPKILFQTWLELNLQAELLKNKEVKRVEMMLAKTPIGTDQFAAAVYNLDTLVYKNNTKTSLILALSIVLGGMLGIFVLLIRNVLIKQD